MGVDPSLDCSRNKKVWVLGMGSRGEIQPLVALALALQRSGGLDVTVMSNTNHGPFVADFDLTFVPVCFDFSATVEDPDFKAAMANNELPKTLAIINREFEEKQGPFIAAFDRMLAEPEAAKPDLILYTLGLFQLAWLADAKHGVPILPADFQPRPFRTGLGPPPGHGLPSLPCGLNVLYSKLFSRVFWHMIVSKQGSLVARNAGGFDPIAMVGYARWEIEFTGQASHPYLCGCSSLMKVLYPSADAIPDNFHLTGPWVIPSEEQISHERSAASGSFGNKDVQEKMDAFLQQSKPPVYIGWGSMLCKSPEYMVHIAVSALMQSKLKGIILGGWAGLSFKTLENALAETTGEDVESILNYAKENVLFVDQAPHEWLFPRVSAIVHHGGAGTTATSLRSGTPTIVTPLGGDQPMHGEWVQRLGAGLCAKGLDRLTAGELGDALLHVTSDAQIIERAKEVGQEMSKEDGTANAVAIVSAHLDVLAEDCANARIRFK